MNSIDTRAPFFPNSKTGQKEISHSKRAQALKRNTYQRTQELNNSSSKDAKVNIPEAVKDFSRIKSAVDMAPPIDNTDKIARLKSQIQAGTYQPNYDAVADKLLSSEY
jgi:negative regulator of flagellin synthesis FlgM